MGRSRQLFHAGDKLPGKLAPGVMPCIVCWVVKPRRLFMSRPRLSQGRWLSLTLAICKNCRRNLSSQPGARCRSGSEGTARAGLLPKGGRPVTWVKSATSLVKRGGDSPKIGVSRPVVKAKGATSLVKQVDDSPKIVTWFPAALIPPGSTIVPYKHAWSVTLPNGRETIVGWS